MKVVLFCGGEGTRLREYSEVIPKPMVPIGHRPILWHIMKYYAYYGHKDFILALGHKANSIKDYFLNYKETDSNDFVFTKGGKDIELKDSDIKDWKITFVDTGINSNIGMRLMNVKEYLKNEKYFLANYSDGVTDMNLNSMIDPFITKNDKIGTFMSYRPKSSLHSVTADNNGIVKSIQPFSYSNLWLNAGFFLFKHEIFDFIKYGDELIENPFQRLIKNKDLTTFQYDGFWQPMDTFKDKMLLDKMYNKGDRHWEVWNNIKNNQD